MRERLKRFIGGTANAVKKLNSMISEIERIRPIAGAGIALTETAEGTQINVISTKQAGVLGSGGEGGTGEDSDEGLIGETFYDEIFGHIVTPKSNVKYVVNFSTKRIMFLQSFGGRMINNNAVFLLQVNNVSIGSISANTTSTWVDLSDYEVEDGSEIAILCGSAQENASGFSFNIRCFYEV